MPTDATRNTYAVSLTTGQSFEVAAAQMTSERGYGVHFYDRTDPDTLEDVGFLPEHAVGAVVKVANLPAGSLPPPLPPGSAPLPPCVAYATTTSGGCPVSPPPAASTPPATSTPPAASTPAPTTSTPAGPLS